MFSLQQTLYNLNITPQDKITGLMFINIFYKVTTNASLKYTRKIQNLCLHSNKEDRTIMEIY